MIELQQLTKRFGKTTAVSGLDLTIPTGKVTVLIGPSGCGKTTTLEMINGLTRPDSGVVRVGGTDISTVDLTTLRRSIGYVIQDVGLFPHYTVRQNIAVVPTLLKWETHKIKERVEQLAEMVNLGFDSLAKYPAQLSGGQQQRVGVARALAANPQYLLMDEPFSALDPVNREGIQDEFKRLQAELGKTVVIVTHDMNEALKLGDRIAVMEHGTLVRVDSPQGLLAKPGSTLVEDFLGGQRISRLLQFTRLCDISDQLMPHTAAIPSGHWPPIATTASIQQAIDLLLQSGSDQVTVVSDQKDTRWLLSWKMIRDFISHQSSATD